MAVLDEDFCTDLTTTEGGDTLWSLPIVAPVCEPLDWASLLEEAEARVKEERGRANVAELRCEELRRTEREARSLANSLTRRLDTCRFKLKTAVPKTASRVTKALERRVESQDGEVADLRLSLRRSHEHREQIEERHRDEINWLKQDIDRGRSEIVKVYRKGERVAESLRKQFDRQFAAARRLVEVRPLDFRAVVHSTREGRLWNEFVARYHYLGYKTLVGAQMRYAVHDRNGWPVAMLGFSTAAWKLAPRDNFIGWTPEKREKNLPLVVDNPRFLILPWVEIPNLGSHILAIVRRRLPGDWTERYGTTPVLIETFVEIPRYTGAVYKASGWTHVGTTQGRGRYDRDRQFEEPRKDVWLRPLRRDWQRTLNR